MFSVLLLRVKYQARLPQTKRLKPDVATPSPPPPPPPPPPTLTPRMKSRLSLTAETLIDSHFGNSAIMCVRCYFGISRSSWPLAYTYQYQAQAEETLYSQRKQSCRTVVPPSIPTSYGFEHGERPMAILTTSTDSLHNLSQLQILHPRCSSSFHFNRLPA